MVNVIKLQHVSHLVDCIGECICHAVEANRALRQCLLNDNGNDTIRSEYNQSLEGGYTSLVEIGNSDPDGRLIPPYTEGSVDANFYGGLTERASVMGGQLSMNGTCVLACSKKNTAFSYNSNDAELNTAFYMGKVVMWICQIMEDLKIPFVAPIPIAEDNRATQLAANIGKISKRTRHLVTQQAALQDFTRSGYTKNYLVPGDKNTLDHFTKLLPIAGVTKHCPHLMGFAFSQRNIWRPLSSASRKNRANYQRWVSRI